MKLFGLKPSVSAAAPRSVQFVPGDYFFMRRFDLPPGTEPGEVAGFLELQFEELSPFPLDQLHHGHIRASDGAAAFGYAAYRRRLPVGLAETWPSAPFVLPDFAPALKLRFEIDTVVLVRSAASLTALVFAAGRELPVRAAGRALAADAPDETVAAVRRAVLALVEPGSAREIDLRLGDAPTQRAQGLMFPVAGAEGEVARELVVPMADCWSMDVREPEFVAEQRKRLRVDLLFWRVVQGAAAVLLLLAVGELLLLAGGGHTAWVRKRLADRQPEALAIADRQALAFGLEDFRQRAIHPFDMFRVLSRGRTPTLYFTNATLEGLRMDIEGEASNVAEFNAYFANLRTAPELAGPPQEGDVKVQANNITTFKITVQFKPGVFAIAGAPAATP